MITAVSILLALTFSKNFYMAAFASYYTFFLIERFGVSVQSAQLHLFLFLGATAAGTIIGGPIGDRIGRKPILWISILGALPLSLALPFVSLFWTDVLAVLIGMIMASAFPAIVVYAQELLPGRVGMIAGLFFGFAFGMGGIGAAVIGWLADAQPASSSPSSSAPPCRRSACSWPSCPTSTGSSRPTPEGMRQRPGRGAGRRGWWLVGSEPAGVLATPDRYGGPRPCWCRPMRRPR